jgi:putative molybdopterin biosynthesis protein
VKQQQFLEVIDRDEAETRWRAVVSSAPLPAEDVPLDEALGRVLGEDVRAEVDVPGFDRSNMDGFAVLASDTFGATEKVPVRLALHGESIPTGVSPRHEVKPGTATTIATGGMLPRGADAVVPVEHTDLEDDGTVVVVRRAVVPGGAVSFAGTDMGRGETVLLAGARLTSRETGVLAAIGRDDEVALHRALEEALSGSDLVLLSGGTSKGEGDLNHRVVSRLDPGIVVHGVALKPGKPICLAAHGRLPVVILPGFPTSAIFTFHEFVAPVLRGLAGLQTDAREVVAARLAQQINSERGRLEYLLVGLVRGEGGALAAYPMGKGSGSVTAFSRADGFVRIGRNSEIVDVDAAVEVTLIGRDLPLADLVVIGSHCMGLDRIASRLSREGLRVKVLAVGSQGGLAAARRGECDVAPIHLLDPESGRYNEPFLSEGLTLLLGYTRMQGVVTRDEETREVAELLADPGLRMVNRNRGSGTRVLIDRLLDEHGRSDLRPPGFAYEPRSHFAVAAAVAQGRADWGVTTLTVARDAGLRFRPLQAEHYDFVVPEDRRDRPAVRALARLLEPGSALRGELEALGFGPPAS